MEQISKETHYSISDLVKIFNVHFKTIQRRIKSGELEYVEHPITGNKYFSKEYIHSKYKIPSK
jgi:hypothetical protein